MTSKRDRDRTTGDITETGISTTSLDVPEDFREEIEREKAKMREEQLHRPGRGIGRDKLRHGEDAKLAEKVGTMSLHDRREVEEGETLAFKAQRRASLPIPEEQQSIDEIIRMADREPQLGDDESPDVELDVTSETVAARDDSHARGHRSEKGRGSGQRDVDRDFDSHGGRTTGVGQEGEVFVRPSKDGKQRWKGRPERDDEWDLGFNEGDRQRMRQDTVAMRGEDVVWPPREEGAPVVTTDERQSERGMSGEDEGKAVDRKDMPPPRQYGGARSPDEVKKRFEHAKEVVASASDAPAVGSLPPKTVPAAETTEKRKTAKMELARKAGDLGEAKKMGNKTHVEGDQGTLVDVGTGGGDTQSRGQMH